MNLDEIYPFSKDDVEFLLALHGRGNDRIGISIMHWVTLNLNPFQTGLKRKAFPGMTHFNCASFKF